MSEKIKFLTKKTLFKEINGIRIYLDNVWDLTHGRGWTCQAYDRLGYRGCGNHKTNKFTAVRQAIKNISING